ncbi:Ankyrin repeat domain-containing protein 16 [Balamuthia mandrillaris]
MAESIITAAREGQCEQVKWFLRHGESVNANAGEEGQTALHEAAKHGHVECVKVLLLSGADVESKDEHGNTPLREAVLQNHVEVAQLLVRAGAETCYASRSSSSEASELEEAESLASSSTSSLVDLLQEARTRWGANSPMAKALRGGASRGDEAGRATEEDEPMTKKKEEKDASALLSRSNGGANERLDSGSLQKGTTTELQHNRPFVYIILEWKGNAMAVIKANEEHSLEEVRGAMKEDEVSLPFAFSFLFRESMAPITKKQESSFLVREVCIRQNEVTNDRKKRTKEKEQEEEKERGREEEEIRRLMIIRDSDCHQFLFRTTIGSS